MATSREKTRRALVVVGALLLALFAIWDLSSADSILVDLFTLNGRGPDRGPNGIQRIFNGLRR